MPFHGNPFTKGRLFVHFAVAFPKTLPANAVAAIKAVLPKPTVPTMTGEEEECNMTDVDLSQFGKHTPSDNVSYNIICVRYEYISLTYQPLPLYYESHVLILSMNNLPFILIIICCL